MSSEKINLCGKTIFVLFIINCLISRIKYFYFFMLISWCQNWSLIVLWTTGLRHKSRSEPKQQLFFNCVWISHTSTLNRISRQQLYLLFFGFKFRWSRTFFALTCSWSRSPLPAGEIYPLSTPCGNYWVLMCAEFSLSTLLEEKGWFLLGGSQTTRWVLEVEVRVFPVKIPVALCDPANYILGSFHFF